MPRDETLHRPTDWSPNKHEADKHCPDGNTALYMPHRSERTQQRTAPQPEPSKGHHPTHGQTAFTPSGHQHSGSAVDSQPYFAIPAQVATTPKHPEPPEVQPRRRVSADQIYAAHREARLEARQALKEEAQTEGLLKSRKAVLPSEIRRRERSVDDPSRIRHEDMDWQSCSPEQQRRSRGEEDWDRERPRERGRDRTVQRIRERGREHISSHLAKQHQSSEPPSLQHEPSAQRQHDCFMTEPGTQILEQDDQRMYLSSKQPRDALKPQHSQRLQEYELHRREPSSQQQESYSKQEARLDEDFEARKQQQDPSARQRSDSAVYLQKGSSFPQARHRGSEVSGGPKPKTRTRSMSDIGISQHSAMYRMERAAGSRESARGGHPAGMANGEMGTLDTRVSVAQLRHSYLENANRKPEL